MAARPEWHLRSALSAPAGACSALASKPPIGYRSKLLDGGSLARLPRTDYKKEMDTIMNADASKNIVTRTVLALALVALAFPVMAADAPVAADAGPYDWSGPYVGVYGGSAKGHDRVKDMNAYNGNQGSFGYGVDGLLGGVDGGYNWQCNHLVLGLEAEVGELSLDDSQQYPPYQGVRLPTDSRASIRSDMSGTLAGRIGYAIDNVLVYAKGGVMGLDAKLEYIDNDDVHRATLDSGTSKDTILGGYTFGGGIEVGLSSHWTVKGEYMVADFNSAAHTAAASNALHYRFSQQLKDLQMFKAGVAYKF